jgi:hypothetical protein
MRTFKDLEDENRRLVMEVIMLHDELSAVRHNGWVQEQVQRRQLQYEYERRLGAMRVPRYER